MEKKGSRWLMGCGLGCGALALLGLLLAVIPIIKGVQMARTFEQVRIAMDEASDDAGLALVGADGAIHPERIEAFLAVRDDVAEERNGLAKRLEILTRAERGEMTAWQALGLAGTVFGFPGDMIEFLAQRNEALLESEMALGEYFYLYAMAYYVWLDHLPEDGPPTVILGDGDDDWTESRKRAHRRERVLQVIHRHVLPLLRRQLSTPEGGSANGGLGAWREQLAAEIEALDADPYRLPWADGLPPALERSFLPFRERLDRSYSEICNPVEMALLVSDD